MRKALLATAAIALCCGGAWASPNKDGKTMAVDDWHSLSIYGVGADSSGATYLQVHAGDLDGDGLPDDAVVKLNCAGNELKQAHVAVVGPRDSASGQASGKRMHPPRLVITKEWGPASPQLRGIKPKYDVKTNTGGRVVSDGWQMLSLAGADGLCPAAAAAVINTSRSNVKSQ